MSDRLSDSRVPWVLCVSVMLDFPRPGKSTLSKDTVRNNFQKEGSWLGRRAGRLSSHISEYPGLHSLFATDLDRPLY